MDFFKVEDNGNPVKGNDLLNREKTRAVQKAVEDVLNKVEVLF